MKHLPAIILVSLLFCSCSDNTKEEKALLNDILKVHDKVMGSDEMLVKNKMKLDSLVKLKKDTVELKTLGTKLATAEEAMENWMSKFEPDVTGKSHDAIMKYYGEQKKAITAIDSQINTAVTQSNQYLLTHKLK